MDLGCIKSSNYNISKSNPSLPTKMAQKIIGAASLLKNYYNQVGGEITHYNQFGGKITPDDIFYRDNNVCILKPEVKKGLLIYTHYTQPKNTDSLCKIGLKSGLQLKKEGIDFGHSTTHPYIFFKAPYYNNPIDYTSIDTEIESSFGKDINTQNSLIWIRIDPENTYVFSSEIRAAYRPLVHCNWPEYTGQLEEHVYRSRKKMTDYLKIIYKNSLLNPAPGERILYNLFTSEGEISPSRYNLEYSRNSQNSYEINKDVYLVNLDQLNINRYPLSTYNINRLSEVLVQIPHLTSDSFVKCT
jgi:hypothetical protein